MYPRMLDSYRYRANKKAPPQTGAKAFTFAVPPRFGNETHSLPSLCALTGTPGIDYVGIELWSMKH